MSLLMRPALYYPRLHFRTIDWLKETLLSFRQVRRIAPENFHFNDPREVQALRKVELVGLGPMVMDESVEDVQPEEAQQRMYHWIGSRPEAELAAFDATHAMREYGSADTFQIHIGKFMSSMLQFLTERHLVWAPRQPERGDTWMAIHPRLGDALMSVMALAIAKHSKLNIVTSEPRAHYALLTQREEDIFASLARHEPVHAREPQSVELATSAAQLIIQKSLDLSWVSLEDVAKIIADGNDFQRFQARLQTLAAEHGWTSVSNPKQQQDQLDALIGAARKEWKAYRRQLGSYARMFVRTAKEEAKKGAIAVVASFGLGAVLGWAAVGTGLLIGTLNVASDAQSQLVQRRKDDPYRYLSQLLKKGGFAPPR